MRNYARQPLTAEEKEAFRAENKRRVLEARKEWDDYRKSLPVTWFLHLTSLKDENWRICGTCGDCVAYKYECCGNTSCNGGGCDVCHDLHNEIRLRIEYGLHPLVMRHNNKEW